MLSYTLFCLRQHTFEYGSVIWGPYISNIKLTIKRIQNRFLSYVVYKYIKNWRPVSRILTHSVTHKNTPSNISSFWRRSQVHFSQQLLGHTWYSMEHKILCPFLSATFVRQHSTFHIPSHITSSGYNHPLHRMLRPFINEPLLSVLTLNI